MVVAVIRELLRRHPYLPPERIDDVAIAAATQIGDQAFTLGRIATILSQTPRSVPGYSIDRMCAGAMTAVTTLRGRGLRSARTTWPSLVASAHGPSPDGRRRQSQPAVRPEKLVDISALSMGATEENLRDCFPNLTRERADAFAVASQAKLAKAYTTQSNRMVPVATRSTAMGWGLATKDEPPRPGRR